MNEKLQNDLVKTYPKIFKNVGFGIECNDGWYDLLDTLCYTMQQHCDVANTRYIIETDKYQFVVEGDPEYVQVVAAQVKEKLGTLRFYADGVDNATEGMIQMAEAMSSRICELCGNPAKTSRDSGWLHTTCTSCNKRIRLERQGWKSGSAEEFLTDSNPDNNPDKVSELEDTDSSASFQSHCHSCGVPWVLHIGIAGTCAENAKLRKERDQARREVLEEMHPDLRHGYADARGWNCYKQEEACDTLSQEVSQDHRDEIAKLRREKDEARREVCEMNAIESSNESVDFLSLTPQDIADERGWDCYASDTLAQDVKFYTLQDAKLRKGIEEAKQGKFSENPPKIKPITKKKKKK